MSFGNGLNKELIVPWSRVKLVKKIKSLKSFIRNDDMDFSIDIFSNR